MNKGWMEKKPTKSGWYWIRDGIDFTGERPARIFKIPKQYKIRVYSKDLKKHQEMAWWDIKSSDYIWKPMLDKQISVIIKKLAVEE